MGSCSLVRHRSNLTNLHSAFYVGWNPKRIVQSSMIANVQSSSLTGHMPGRHLPSHVLQRRG